TVLIVRTGAHANHAQSTRPISHCRIAPPSSAGNAGATQPLPQSAEVGSHRSLDHTDHTGLVTASTSIPRVRGPWFAPAETDRNSSSPSTFGAARTISPTPSSGS